MKIVILDDHRLLADLLASSLQAYDFIKSIKIYSDPNAFLAHLDHLDINVLITDMLMPEMTGSDVAVECRKKFEKTKLRIMVLSTVTNSNVVKKAFKDGVNAYLCKDASVEEVVKAIKFMFVEPEKYYVGESLKDIFLQSQLQETISFNFSPREKELLHKICLGRTVKEVASDLDLSVNTVQSYMKQLMKKMGVNRTPELILKAIKFGLFHPNYLS